MKQKSKRVLFVDDEPWFHESLRFALESKGFECLSVEDMTSALEILSSEDINVVVTDIMMPAGKDFPKMDSQETGFHFIRKMRERWHDLRIVCLSVIGDQAKIRLLRRFKVEYLRKGEVTLATAVQTIERAAGSYKY